MQTFKDLFCNLTKPVSTVVLRKLHVEYDGTIKRATHFLQIK